ncbi:MAG TPA: hypothetical protein VM681_09080 [Candidatus Thermoplasmatota archaeon]|nr:hypothetical protein [Candidatus Thermoplasmatota archaeon]
MREGGRAARLKLAGEAFKPAMNIHRTMAAGFVLVYGHPPAASRTSMNRLQRALFGWTDRGRERPGLLAGKPHLLLRRNVLLLPADLAPRVEEVAKEHGAWVWKKAVALSPGELSKVPPVSGP